MLRINKEGIRKSIHRHPISLSLLVMIINLFYLLTRTYEPLGEVVMIYFMLGLLPPTILVGILSSKEVAPRVGLAFGLAFTIILLFVNISFPIEFIFFFILGFLPLAFSVGIITTWLGSLVGDTLREVIKKQNLKLKSKTAFLLNFICPILVWIYIGGYVPICRSIGC